MPTEPTDDFPEVPIRITLSERDWDAFIAAIENPPPPNAELRKLFRDFPPAE